MLQFILVAFSWNCRSSINRLKNYYQNCNKAWSKSNIDDSTHGIKQILWNVILIVNLSLLSTFICLFLLYFFIGLLYIHVTLLEDIWIWSNIQQPTVVFSSKCSPRLVLWIWFGFDLSLEPKYNNMLGESIVFVWSGFTSFSTLFWYFPVLKYIMHIKISILYWFHLSWKLHFLVVEIYPESCGNISWIQLCF